MKREYPDILNCEKEPHKTQFLPDCYLYGELTSKVSYNISMESLINKLPTLIKILLAELSKKYNIYLFSLNCRLIKHVNQKMYSS
jgi:hypothetical protein